MRAGLFLVAACAAFVVVVPGASSGGEWCGGVQEQAADRLPDAVGCSVYDDDGSPVAASFRKR